MKALLTIFISIFILSSAQAINFEGIKIGTNGQSAIELRLTSKKVATATITITNEAGIVVSTQAANIVKGNNSISLTDVATLSEGMYTVTMVSNNKTVSTKFMNWK
jgi:fructose-specific phosphotransferase system component IIB